MNTRQLIMQGLYLFLGDQRLKCFWCVAETDGSGFIGATEPFTDFSEFRVRTWFGGEVHDFHVGLNEDGGEVQVWQASISRLSQDFTSKARAFVLADPKCFDQIVEYLSDE